jgi:hypothetical protein
VEKRSTLGFSEKGGSLEKYTLFTCGLIDFEEVPTTKKFKKMLEALKKHR